MQNCFDQVAFILWVRGSIYMEDEMVEIQKENRISEESKKRSISTLILSTTKFNYAQSRAKVKIEGQIEILNELDPIKDAVVEVSILPKGFIEDIIIGISSIQETKLEKFELTMHAEAFAPLTESIEGQMNVILRKGDDQICTASQAIEFLPFEQWSGIPKELAVFVTPNSPLIDTLIHEVSEELRRAGSMPELDGYQSDSAKRIDQFCVATYDVLQRLGLTYCEPPASFEDFGQRIRSVDSIMTSKFATCIDSSLLFASVLEALGLNPVIILYPSHAVVGCWLYKEKSLDTTVSANGSFICDNMRSGERSLRLIETTCLTNYESSNYLQACSTAEIRAEEKKDEIQIIDIAYCRLGGIKPLPQTRILGDGNICLLSDSEESCPYDFNDDEYGKNEIDLSAFNPAVEDKIIYWSRRLLDLTTRNILIHLRLSRKTVLPILSTDISKLEDELFKGCEFNICSTPLDQLLQDFMTKPLEIPENAARINQQFHSRNLSTNLTSEELTRRLKVIYRQMQSDLAESGANTLYMSFGILNWYEKNGLQRYAPLILVPVRIHRISATQYKVARRDGEPTINYSILEKLRQDFQIDIRLDSNNLPMDDQGVDIEAILKIFLKSIQKEKSWTVIPYAAIGIFSFSQFVIYNDLINRRTELENHHFVKSLIISELSEPKKEIPEVYEADIENLLLPISCDESQLRAVKAAQVGCDFILQGPPGTGKSQTISAIIANMISKGKSVLFVAEKRAALEVVQRNLNKLSLKDFILELHSNKATKEHVLEQFENALSADRLEMYNLNPFVQTLVEKRNQLHEYITALHRKHSCGQSFYKLADNLAEFENSDVVCVTLDAKELENLSSADIERRSDFLLELEEVSRPFFPISRSPLKFLSITDWTPVVEQYIFETFGLYQDVFCKLSNSVNDIVNQYFPSQKFESINDSLKFLRKLFSTLTAARKSKLPDIIRKSSDLVFISQQLSRYVERLGAVRKIKETLPIQIDKEIYVQEDIKHLLYDWRSALQAGFFVKGKIRKQVTRILQKYSMEKVSPEIVDSLLVQLMSMTEALNGVASERKNILPDITAAISDIMNNESALHDIILEITSYQQSIEAVHFSLPNLTSHSCRALINNDLFMTELIATIELHDHYQNLVITLKSSTFVSSDLFELSYGDQCNEIDDLLSHLCDLQNWARREFVRSQLEKFPDIIPIVDAYEHGEIVGAMLSEVFIYSYYQALVVHIMQTDPILNKFSSETNTRRIEELKHKEETYVIAAGKELLGLLSEQKPDTTLEVSQMSKIKRAIASKGRSLSLRQLFAQIPSFYSKIFPCYLMSPLSVAQYLDAGLPKFDIVIFDEASQLTTSKAIGAISRGEQIIVVGDPKQMPPTSFFQKKEDESLGNDSQNFLKDLESILDDCLALNLPEVFLSWHYRSNHESLIQFSNARYYRNRLKTYPSTDALCSHVRFKKVEGFYTSRSSEPNPAEVFAIVDDIQYRLSNKAKCNQSIGVITFNERQQVAIIDQLDRLFEKHPKLASQAHWYDDSGAFDDTKLFVKNLENVQGDERDVILFSVCYGPTKEKPSSVPLNIFGPIIQLGGERRLNVAFSRAKEEMVIYTIMDPFILEGRSETNRGLQDFASFLRYAYDQSRKEIQLDNDGKGIAQAIGTLLAENGYRISYNVGSSDFKIDIAICKPDSEKEFSVGIMLDGPIYASARTARDREVLRPLFLSRRGWKILQVNCIDWVREAKITREKLLTEVALQFAIHDEADHIEKVFDEIVPSDTSNIDIERIEVVTNNFIWKQVPYNVAELVETNERPQADILQKVYWNELLYRIDYVIQKEGPVAESVVRVKVQNSFGLSRSGNRLQTVFKHAFDTAKNTQKYHVTQQNYSYERERDPELLQFYWPASVSPDEYTAFRVAENENRKIEDISFEEMCNGLSNILRRIYVLSEDEVITNVSSLFGYQKRTKKLYSVITECLKWGIKNDRFTVDEKNNYVLNSKE